MADRDYRVIYKSRTVPKNSETIDERRGSQLPDPYESAYSSDRPNRQRSVQERDSGSSFNEGSTLTAPSRVSRMIYPIRTKDRFNDAYADLEQSPRDSPRRSSRFDDEDRAYGSKRPVVVDQRSSQSRYPQDSNSVYQDVSRQDLDADFGRPRGRQLGYEIDNSVRREGGAYAIDARQGDIIDVTVPTREREKNLERDGPRYVYLDDKYPRPKEYYDERDYREGEKLPSGVIVLRRDVTPPRQSGSRFTYDDQASRSRPTPRAESEDDWRLVESMRDTRISSAYPHDDQVSGRPRAPTQSSEDSYVMVSPTQTRTETSLRSALQRADYPPAELRRRRSRSISFRRSEIVNHDCSESRHERPGAEANICGAYLRSRRDDDSDVTSTYRSSRDRDRPRQRSEVTEDYSRDDRYAEPYSPQHDYTPRRRSSRSRQKRRDDDDDNRSYFSEHKNYVRETKYS